MTSGNDLFLKITEDFGLSPPLGGALFDDLAALGDRDISYYFLSGLSLKSALDGSFVPLGAHIRNERHILPRGGFVLQQAAHLTFYLPKDSNHAEINEDDQHAFALAIRDMRHTLFWQDLAKKSKRPIRSVARFESLLSPLRDFDCLCAGILASTPDCSSNEGLLAQFPMLQQIRGFFDDIFQNIEPTAEKPASFFDKIKTFRWTLQDTVTKAVSPALRAMHGVDFESCTTMDELERIKPYATMLPADFVHNIILHEAFGLPTMAEPPHPAADDDYDASLFFKLANLEVECLQAQIQFQIEATHRAILASAPPPSVVTNNKTGNIAVFPAALPKRPAQRHEPAEPSDPSDNVVRLRLPREAPRNG